MILLASVPILALYFTFQSCQGYALPSSTHSGRSATTCSSYLIMSAAVPHRLVTNKMCPFAQKAWIALETSKAPFQLEEISLYGANGKPDWFRKLNPKGTVPVLVVSSDNGKSFALPDSDLILDALEQGKVPGCQVSLSSKEEQEAITEWRKRINQMLPIGKKAVYSGSIGASLEEKLKEMDAAVVGPYLTGERLTTADCHAFPFLWRLQTEFGLSSKYPNLTRWIDHCGQNEPSFRKTIQSAWWWWW